MTILSELKTICDTKVIPFYVGHNAEAAEDTYVVAVPLTDTYALHGDNAPMIDVQEVRINLFKKGNYIATKNALVGAFLDAGFTITERTYVGYEADKNYHHYAIDVAKFYEEE